MQIPDTPEQFFEALADNSISEVFPQYDRMPVLYQKLLRTIHAELTKGELSDAMFRDMLLFVTTVWLTLNNRALEQVRRTINESEDIDTDWIASYGHFGRMDNYLAVIMSVVKELPALSPENDADGPITGHYSLLGPGD